MRINKTYFNPEQFKLIKKLLNEWWQDEETCSGELCSIKECDLCITCFDRLCNKFGCEWTKGEVKELK